VLTSPAVSITNIEQSTLTLLREFLASYFNGAPHDIGLNLAVSWPQVELTFQKSRLPQPLTGTSISAVWVESGRPSRTWEWAGEQRQKVLFIPATLQFFVRSKGQPTSEGNASYAVMHAADLLFLLLSSPNCTQTLAQKGVHHLRPLTPKLLIPAGDDLYEMRQLTLRCTLRFPLDIASGETGTLTLSGLPSGESFGTTWVASDDVFPASVVTEEVFGVPSVNLVLSVSGLATGAAFGVPALSLTVSPSGIATGEAFGSHTVSFDVWTDGLDIWLDGAPVVNVGPPGDFDTWLDGVPDPEFREPALV
jgi:hypothetical protein